MKRRFAFIAGIILSLALCLAQAVPAVEDRSEDGGPAAAGDQVRVEFFFEPGCGQCAQVKAEVLPELEIRYGGFYTLIERDITVRENYLALAAYQEKLGTAKNAPVSMVLDGRIILFGVDEIKADLFARIDELAAGRLSGGGDAPPVTAAPEAVKPADDGLLKERLRRFTLLGVIAAGLVDGINPCAISTLVFFMSLLAVLKVTGRRLLVVGLSFVFASFVTYAAIGFGLLRALHLFSGFAAVRAAVNTVMIAVLAVFAALSFLDAWRYHRTGRAGDVTLQLPEKIKRRIHAIMRGGLGTKSLLFGSLFIGSSVTVLESVCTGQVYVPTLVMLIKSGGAGLSGYLYLLLYNLMFQVPIAVVFVLTLQGIKTASLMNMSKKSVVISKIAMGLFFVAMAALIILL